MTRLDVGRSARDDEELLDEDARMRGEDATRHGWKTVAPSKRPVLFVNRRSGGGKAERTGLAERARERGVEVVTLDERQSLEDLVEDAIVGGADALGMAGGDGSLRTVAAAASRHDLPFVCVPAGTRNHFARDVGIDPRDVMGAIDAFGDAFERRIDMGEVNGRGFLNNVSLGIYGDAVRHPQYRGVKIRTLLESIGEVMGPGGTADEIQVVDDQGVEHRHPAIVLVSNNPYALDGSPRRRGARPVLDGGVLGMLVLDAHPNPPNPPGRAWTSQALQVKATAPVHAGIDGEAVDLHPPLSFRTRPRSLRVRISSRQARLT